MHHPLFGATVYPDNCFQTSPLPRRETASLGKLSTLNPERFLSTRRIVRLPFDEGKQFERNEARD